MMDSINSFIKAATSAFFDNSHSLTVRVAAGVIVLSLIYLIDNQVGFSFYYGTSSKIEQIEKLTAVIRVADTDSSAIREMKTLRLSIIKHQSFFQRLWSLTNAAINSRSIQTQNASPTSIIDNKRDVALHFISANWFFLAMIIKGIFNDLSKQTLTLKDIGTTLLAIGVIIILCLIFAYFLSFIPLIDDQPIYNYSINAVLSGIISVLLVRYIVKFT